VEAIYSFTLKQALKASSIPTKCLPHICDFINSIGLQVTYFSPQTTFRFVYMPETCKSKCKMNT